MESYAKPVGISKSSKTFSTPTFLDHFEAPKRIFFGTLSGPKIRKIKKTQKTQKVDKPCSTPTFLAHVRTFRPPASPITGPELVPGRPRPELGNVYLINRALHTCFFLMFAVFDPPPAPSPAPSWFRAGPGRSSGMCISHVGAHARARARTRAHARARARSPNSVFALKGGRGGSVPPSLSDSL